MIFPQIIFCLFVAVVVYGVYRVVKCLTEENDDDKFMSVEEVEAMRQRAKERIK